MSNPAQNINRQRLINFLHENYQVHNWEKVREAHIIGSFADPNNPIDDRSDLDVMLIWNHVDDFVENQNTFPKGINGTKSARKWDNPKIQTPNHGKRPVDIVELTPLDEPEVPPYAIKLL